MVFYYFTKPLAYMTLAELLLALLTWWSTQVYALYIGAVPAAHDAAVFAQLLSLIHTAPQPPDHRTPAPSCCPSYTPYLSFVVTTSLTYWTGCCSDRFSQFEC